MEKSILVSIIAVCLVLTLVSVVSADKGLTSGFTVTVNGVEYTSGNETISVEAGETIPIKVVFTATEDASDVKLKAEIEGYRSDISDKTSVFELVEGSAYSKYLSLKVPSDIDPTENYELIIRLANKDKHFQNEYSLTLQRESYNLEVLSAEIPDKVTPGSVIAVDVVLKNRGMHELEDVFVKARISDLGIEKKVYFGDLDPRDECEYELDEESDIDELIEIFKDCDREDAVERTIYLVIPDDAKAGLYSLEVEAYNVDSLSIVKKNLIISGVEEISDVLSGIGAKTLDVGEEVIYDLVIINSGAKMKVYTLTPEEVKGLIVEVEPIVTVPADSSKTVKVRVRATESAEEGTHIITINAKSEGELVKTVNFSANVEKMIASSSIVILTVILAIIFVVLLIILIVLLTRKPASVETEETSYY